MRVYWLSSCWTKKRVAPAGRRRTTRMCKPSAKSASSPRIRPVIAGHDQFPIALVHQILGRKEVEEIKDVFCCDDILNMTFFALNLSHYVNGVAKKHGEITRLMFAGYNIDAITNGVHAASWAAKPFAELYDRYIPGWLRTITVCGMQ